jgi:predicted thioesterase
MEITNKIPIGTVVSKSVEVTRDLTVAHFLDHMPEVLATPMMILMMEVAAQEAVDKFLPEGWTTVGTMVNISHLAATPVGFTVTARAEILSIEGTMINFAVEAFDGVEKIGVGKHSRAAVQVKNFENRVKTKKKPTV